MNYTDQLGAALPEQYARALRRKRVHLWGLLIGYLVWSGLLTWALTKGVPQWGVVAITVLFGWSVCRHLWMATKFDAQAVEILASWRAYAKHEALHRLLERIAARPGGERP